MKKTTKTEYFYNEDEHICRSITTETSDCCDCGDCEVENGVELDGELDGVIEMSPLEILLTATVGTLLGNLLYRAIRKD